MILVILSDFPIMICCVNVNFIINLKNEEKKYIYYHHTVEMKLKVAGINICNHLVLLFTTTSLPHSEHSMCVLLPNNTQLLIHGLASMNILTLSALLPPRNAQKCKNSPPLPFVIK